MQAWETIVKANIIDIPGHGLIQTIISQPVKWTSQNNLIILNTHRRVDRELATSLGTPLIQHAGLRTPEDDSR